MLEMLYSLMNVDERFARLVLDPVYIRHLDLTIAHHYSIMTVQYMMKLSIEFEQKFYLKYIIK